MDFLRLPHHQKIHLILMICSHQRHRHHNDNHQRHHQQLLAIELNSYLKKLNSKRCQSNIPLNLNQYSNAAFQRPLFRVFALLFQMAIESNQCLNLLYQKHRQAHCFQALRP